MDKIFGIDFEFDKELFWEKVRKKSTTSKGYCCFVDLNSLAWSAKSDLHRTALSESYVNICDGGYVAMLAGFIHKKKFQNYYGPDFFKEFVKNDSTQVIIGNTKQNYVLLDQKLNELENISSKLHHISLPFKNVDSFDYLAIAKEINMLKPRYIWVSLGAPKQETFMFNLLPHIDKGIMFGIGAALNYYVGQSGKYGMPKWARRYKVVWILRILEEPKKQFIRLISIIRILPKIIYNEYRDKC
jgi:N-acetylglucosaminyldiphosphoundecaprenol N-acetyl-beta-D-mannosaminyltransferase